VNLPPGAAAERVARRWNAAVRFTASCEGSFRETADPNLEGLGVTPGAKPADRELRLDWP